MHREFFNGLSDETRYNRMMNALRELSPAMMVRFTQLDYAREMALIGVIEENGGDAIVGGDTLAERKPSPAPLLYIAERFGVPAGQALMVGDSQTDADAAQAAGMPLLLVRYGYHHGRVPEAGDAVAFTDDLRSLL